MGLVNMLIERCNAKERIVVVVAAKQISTDNPVQFMGAIAIGKYPQSRMMENKCPNCGDKLDSKFFQWCTCKKSFSDGNRIGGLAVENIRNTEKEE